MLTHSTTLYFATVLIWGSSWLTIKFQLGVVAPEVSVAYRFGLASVILLIYAWHKGLRLRFSAREHSWIALQGVFLFCINYLVFYWATGLLTTGLIAVLFSTIVFMNIFLGALFFGDPVRADVFAGASLGLAGICLVFWPQIADFDGSSGTALGLGLSLVGTALASLGNMASVRNQRNALPVIQTNAFGMGYGALIMLVLALLSGQPFNYDPAPGYTISLVYLSVFGSILAFGSYLTLIGRIGADRAAYVTVLFPIVALALSTLFEGYQWSATAVTGIALILAGNLLIVSKSSLPRARRRIGRLLGAQPARSLSD